jgi:hypothetical protein
MGQILYAAQGGADRPRHAPCMTSGSGPFSFRAIYCFLRRPSRRPSFSFESVFCFSIVSWLLNLKNFFLLFLSIRFPFLSHLLLKYIYAVLKKFRFTNFFFVLSRIQRGNSNGARFPLNLWGIHLLGYRYREL